MAEWYFKMQVKLFWDTSVHLAEHPKSDHSECKKPLNGSTLQSEKTCGAVLKFPPQCLWALVRQQHSHFIESSHLVSGQWIVGMAGYVWALRIQWALCLPSKWPLSRDSQFHRSTDANANPPPQLNHEGWRAARDAWTAGWADEWMHLWG